MQSLTDASVVGVSQRLAAYVVVPISTVLIVVEEVVGFVLVNVFIRVLVRSAREGRTVQRFSIRSEFHSQDFGRSIVGASCSYEALRSWFDVHSHD